MAYVAGNKGTLVPGQAIAVNKFTVQVERYLSQGGFAHVYLVRTTQPVFGTTRHVLKRMAVQNDALLSEVKKEVDIMRILRGHPNIVYLIDAAWHQLPNGTYEVFILMEFCQGGGIIDMMNRRLRERLTEAEILQIFVDVCEGVAAMHNLKPPLLHRDLKVENILQASASSYKLCDFGSATPVMARPPANNAEVRALEADLNRHTTLQYRAPEMIDPYLRRPIDEKSDVWALGVLLYKLCYYTTPFEEHGPLAILNVQYKIPPYPVYSAQMNGLIASMLRELGPQRPSVFEVLNAVHALRGTKSRFNYSLPEAQPLSPTKRASMLTSSAHSNSLEGLVSYRGGPEARTSDTNAANSAQVATGVGVQAREKVLEAIAPMRRGRPIVPGVVTAFGTGLADRASSPVKKPTTTGTDDLRGWKQVKGHKSGVVSSGAWRPRGPTGGMDDAWKPKGLAPETRSPAYTGTHSGFGDAFVGMPGSVGSGTGVPSISVGSSSNFSPVPSRPGSNSESSSATRGPRTSTATPKDAFHGLGFVEKPPAPTLAEASIGRQGLTSTGALSSSETARLMRSKPSPIPRASSSAAQLPSNTLSSRTGPSASAVKPFASPQPTIQPPQLPHRPSSGLKSPLEDLTPEQRFPSLEELDRTFASPSPALPSTSYGGIRSQPVTGGIMLRDPQPSSDRRFGQASDGNGSDTAVAVPVRPVIPRKHRSSVIVNTPEVSADQAPESLTSKQSHTVTRSGPKDWLTGDDDVQGIIPSSRTADLHNPPGTPVLRESPSKRASFIERSDVPLEIPQQAVTASPPRPPRSQSSLSLSTAQSVGAPGLPPSSGLTENWSPIRISHRTGTEEKRSSVSSSGSSEGPEDAKGYHPTLDVLQAGEPRRRIKGRQSTVHDLVDLYGGNELSSVATRTPFSESRHQPVAPQGPSTNAKPPVAPKPAASRDKSVPALPQRPGSKLSQHKVTPRPTQPNAASSPVKSRPQSMFMFPVSKATSAGNASSVALPGLAPRTTPAARSTHRRSSISDMVQLYESYTGNGNAKSSHSPVSAPRPGALKVNSRVSNTSTASIPSPSAAASRFPQLSPTTALSGATPLGTRSPSPAVTVEHSSKAVDRSSPVGSLRVIPLPTGTNVARQSPAKRPTGNGYMPSAQPYKVPLKLPAASSSTATANSSSGSRSPIRERGSSTALDPASMVRERRTSITRNTPNSAAREHKISTTREAPGTRERKQSLVTPRPTPIKIKTNNTADEPPSVGSPSPERPYQGVGKLIDRWQKNIAEAEASNVRSTNRGGAEPRRTAATAGRGA